MLVKIKNTSSRLKTIPGLPGVRHFIKPGETKVVELPDDLPTKKAEAWACAGLAVWYDPEEDAPEPAPTQTPEISPPAAVEPAKGPAPKAAPKTAPKPAPKAPKATDAGDAAPAPWQRGLEAPK